MSLTHGSSEKATWPELLRLLLGHICPIALWQQETSFSVCAVPHTGFVQIAPGFLIS
jgi:hypothetical protein